MNEMACQAVATARQGRARGTRATVDSAPIGISSPVIVASAMVSGLSAYSGKTKVCQRCGQAYVPASGHQKFCSECREIAEKERHTEYRALHRNEICARRAKYHEEHHEKEIAYYTEHREELLEKNRTYYAEHREARQAYSIEHREQRRTNQAKYCEERRVYRAEHREKLQVVATEYRRRHPEKVQQWLEKRRALKYGNTPVNELLTEAQWRDILDQYHHRCAYCGRKMDKLTIDHVIPLSKGGKHSANNVVPACRHCNSVKGARDPKQWVGIHV